MIKPNSAALASAPPVRRSIRATISLSGVVWDMAQTLMDQGGYNGNFSSYVADRIRRHHEVWCRNQSPARKS